MKLRHLFQIAGAGAIALIVCSCEEIPPYAQEPLAGRFPWQAQPSGYWNDEGASGSPKIVVHIGEQKAYFYKGKHLVGESTVSTGKPGFSTPPGHYHIVTKDRDHVSSVFGDYVDDYGNVVRSPPAVGHTFRWRANALRHVLQWRLRDAPRLCSAVCRIARLHPCASRNGATILRKRSRRHASDRNRIEL